MKYYAVIDTNVVVSSMLKNQSIPGQIIDLVTRGTIVPLVNEEILNEYLEVITRNKFNFNSAVINGTMNIIKSKAIYLQKEQTLEDFIDKDDIVFFEIVMSARSTMDAYLITGNMKHYPIRSYIVTPTQMLEIIEKDKESKGKKDNP